MQMAANQLNHKEDFIVYKNDIEKLTDALQKTCLG
jgi:hypothetical protein